MKCERLGRPRLRALISAPEESHGEPIIPDSRPARGPDRRAAGLRSADASGDVPTIAHLAGLPVRDELVLALARLVDHPDLAGRLETAYGRCTRVLALTVPERETILVALDDPPAGLEKLRGVLLGEHTARVRGEMA